MDFSNLTKSLSETFGNALPTVLGALVVLIIGWLIAKTVSNLVRKSLGKMNLDERLMKK